MRFLLFFILLYSASVLSAGNKPEYAVSKIPFELLPNAKAVIRDSWTEFEVKSASSARQSVRFAVTRFSAAAPYSSLVVPYNQYSKVGKIKAWLYDANGNEVRKMVKDELQDFSAVDGVSIYQDNRVKYADLSYGQYPYTIEYEYELFYSEITNYPMWDIQEFGTAVEQSQYIIRLPETMKYHYKKYNVDVEPLETRASGMVTHHWKATKIKAVKQEPFIAQPFLALASVLITPGTFQVKGYTGSMSSWKDFGAFMYQLNAGRDELSPTMKAKVNELIADATTDVEKIERLYRYLQQNMRYVSVQLGIGGWQTFDANYVEQNKYGDCKALTNFMKSMLKEAKIQSYPALIGNGSRAFEVTEDFTVPYFNHVILHVPSESLWLECTSTNYPPNYIGSSNADRNVLLITEEGGKLIRTPALSSTDNVQQSITTIELSAEGEATLENTIQLSGATQEAYRYYSKNMSSEEFKKWFLENNSLPMNTIQALQVQSEQERPEASLHYKLTIPRYASKAGKRLFVPINSVNVFSSVPPEVEGRQFQFQISTGYQEQDSIIFQLPADMQIESIPQENVQLESDFGQYSLQITQEAGTVTCLRKLKINAIKAAPERYTELRDFYKQIAKLDDMKMVLVQKRT